MISSLSDLPLFAGLSPAECAEFEQRMRCCDFTPQATIVREGSEGDAAFVILEGLVAVRRRDPDSGVEFLLSELGPGQMFGEMALLTKKPRAASVVALAPTTCAMLSRADFERVMREHPNVALGVAAAFALRLDRANQRAGVDYVSLARVQIDPRILSLLPQSLVSEHKAVPIAFCNNRLTLAMTNPNNIVAYDDVRRILKGVLIEPVVVTEDDLRRFMATTYAQAMAKPQAALPKSPAAPAAGGPVGAGSSDAKANRAAMVDLLQSDLVRELQLAADTDANAALACCSGVAAPSTSDQPRCLAQYARRLTALDVAEVLATVEPRITRLLDRRGLGEGDDDSAASDAWVEDAPVLYADRGRSSVFQ